MTNQTTQNQIDELQMALAEVEGDLEVQMLINPAHALPAESVAALESTAAAILADIERLQAAG